jgi:hypothetical protein
VSEILLDENEENDSEAEEDFKEGNSKKNPEDLFSERMDIARNVSEMIFGLFNKFVSGETENERMVNSWLQKKMNL